MVSIQILITYYFLLITFFTYYLPLGRGMTDGRVAVPAGKRGGQGSGRPTASAYGRGCPQPAQISRSARFWVPQTGQSQEPPR